MPTPSVEARRAAISDFAFRDIHPRLFFGTASDRYAGWVGQVYPDGAWADRAKKRTKRLGGRSFEEHTLPVGSTRDYFRHFSVVELDFTFYRPLLDAAGERTSNHFVLDQYAEAAPDDALFLLKAPQAYSARILRKGRGYEENGEYLDADAFLARFYEPALEILGDRLWGVLFEQEYQRVAESPEPGAFVAELDGFFRRVPRGVPLHLEVRSEHLLTPAYFDWLAGEGLGHVFSHWTWLPPIKRQWEMAGARFTAPNTVVARLLTPRNVKYADAYALAHPFDRAVAELSETEGARRMVDEAVALAFHAIKEGRTLAVVANNRAWGNAPRLAQAVASRFLDFAAAKEE